MEKKDVSIKCWAAVNKNGFISLFTDQPQRNTDTGKWEGNLYLNSVIYKMIVDLFEKANFSWMNDPEYFEFGVK